MYADQVSCLIYHLVSHGKFVVVGAESLDAGPLLHRS